MTIGPNEASSVARMEPLEACFVLLSRNTWMAWLGTAEPQVVVVYYHRVEVGLGMIFGIYLVAAKMAFSFVKPRILRNAASLHKG